MSDKSGIHLIRQSTRFLISSKVYVCDLSVFTPVGWLSEDICGRPSWLAQLIMADDRRTDSRTTPELRKHNHDSRTKVGDYTAQHDTNLRITFEPQLPVNNIVPISRLFLRNYIEVSTYFSLKKHVTLYIFPGDSATGSFITTSSVGRCKNTVKFVKTAESML